MISGKTYVRKGKLGEVPAKIEKKEDKIVKKREVIEKNMNKLEKLQKIIDSAGQNTPSVNDCAKTFM